MALRLQDSQGQLENSGNRLVVEPNLNQAIQTALDLTSSQDTLHILTTCSAMLEVRGILTGRKIL